MVLGRLGGHKRGHLSHVFRVNAMYNHMKSILKDISPNHNSILINTIRK